MRDYEEILKKSRKEEEKLIRKEAKKLEKMYKKEGISVDFSGMTTYDELWEKVNELERIWDRRDELDDLDDLF